MRSGPSPFLPLLTSILSCVRSGPERLPDPKVASLYDPPAVYASWWAQAESCAGRKRDFARLRWYAVAGPYLDTYGWSTYETDSVLPVKTQYQTVVYIRANRTLDFPEVASQMAILLVHSVFGSGSPDHRHFERTLRCMGVSTEGWRAPWRPNP